MQCFKFIKVMMILFNLLIFVSMEGVGFLGSLKKQTTIWGVQAREQETVYPDSDL